MSENYVDSIPRGKNDPPMLAWNPTETLMYDSMTRTARW